MPGTTHLKSRRAFSAALSAVLLGAAASPLLAQPTGEPATAWPEKPITLIVPYPPGGQFDTHARVLARQMSLALGQQIVIDNRGGAGTSLGGEAGARARPDGYTLLLAGGTTLTIAPHTISSVRYKIEDFTPVSLISIIPVAIMLNPQAIPVKDFKEFVAYARANPGKVTYATTSPGGVSHLLGEMIMARLNIDIVPVHYKGSGPALLDFGAGRVAAMSDSLPMHLQAINAGTRIGLAVTTDKRMPTAPQVPTFAELGYPELGVSSWGGVVGPRGLPPAIVQKLHRAVVQAVNSEEYKSRVLADAVMPATNTPAEFEALIKRDYAVWGELIRKIGGIKLD